MRAVLFSALLLLAGPALAGDEPDPVDDAQPIGAGDFDAAADRLGLTDAQRKQVGDAVYASQAQKVELKAKVERAQLDLKHLLAAQTLDDKAVMKAVDALNAAEGDLRRNKVQLVLTLRRTLSEDQWDELVEMRRERRQNR